MGDVVKWVSSVLDGGVTCGGCSLLSGEDAACRGASVDWDRLCQRHDSHLSQRALNDVMMPLSPPCRSELPGAHHTHCQHPAAERQGGMGLEQSGRSR